MLSELWILCIVFEVASLSPRCVVVYDVFFVQAEDGIRDLVRSRGLGDVYKRQGVAHAALRAGVQPAKDDHRAGVRATDGLLRPVEHLSLIHI